MHELSRLTFLSCAHIQNFHVNKNKIEYLFNNLYLRVQEITKVCHSPERQLTQPCMLVHKNYFIFTMTAVITINNYTTLLFTSLPTDDTTYCALLKGKYGKKYVDQIFSSEGCAEAILQELRILVCRHQRVKGIKYGTHLNNELSVFRQLNMVQGFFNKQRKIQLWLGHVD